MFTRQTLATLVLLVTLSPSLEGLAESPPESPCICDKEGYEAATTVRVAERDIEETREEVLARAEAREKLRLAFALAFCGEIPKAFKRVAEGTLGLQGTACRAKSRGPRPWPELIELVCEEEPLPQAPKEFEFSADSEWSVLGEELNRVWEKRILARRPAKCQ